MELRPASQEDFEIFMQLYDDLDADLVYPCEPLPQAIEDSHFLDGFDIESIQYNKREFDIDLKLKNILFIENDQQVIGYFRFFRITSRRYKFAEWTVAKEYQYLKEKIWKLFLMFFSTNLKHVEELDICLPPRSTFLPWFKSHGFLPKGTSFFTLYLHQQNQKTDST